MRTRISLLLISLLAPCLTISAQEQDVKVVKDLELWTSAGVSKKINKHWKISLDQEVRFINEMSAFDVWFSDLGIDYKLNKHIRFGTNYRFYQVENDNAQLETQHRLSVDFKYKQKIERFGLEYRMRFQNKDEDFLDNESDKNIANIRNRLSVEYDIKNFKADPFFDIELYRRMYDLENGRLSKLRWTLGVQFPVYKNSDIKLFYRLDNELNEMYPKDTYIIGLGYSYSF